MRLLKIKSLPSVKEVFWFDRDNIMLHACFQLLEDCVEQEKVDESWDYETSKDFVDEVRFLYDWWQRNKDNEEDDQAQEMLERLIKIRGQLWT